MYAVWKGNSNVNLHEIFSFIHQSDLATVYSVRTFDDLHG